MTQEDKELLLRDLCARLPYGVKAQDYDDEPPYIIVAYDGSDFYDHDEWEHKVDKIKPYLFPPSSMTDEQKDEYHDTCNIGLNRWGDESYYATDESIDWLNTHHFDYRGLIDKGLALDASELNVY